MKVNWKDLTKKFPGLWIALKEDEETVVAYGKDAKIVYQEAKQKGVEIPILHKVPSAPVFYIG